MICKECKKEGLKSTIYIASGGITTLMGDSRYYDEEGNYHHHDPNKTSARHWCSNGHEWYVTSQTKCPSCDYGKKIT